MVLHAPNHHPCLPPFPPSTSPFFPPPPPSASVYIGVAVFLPVVISCFGFIPNDYGVAFGLAGGWW